ncbi:hypothetical protein PF002_g19941 [Phytophthora fragariae]|uniref:Uncharacterized protein n=1 Tax=Phytophthora fragariae TaxID=53985 RepID=A0A6A3XQJ5_9STRA|nr:hypothetical protein PF009_g19675 [Phytophthora fragariae]KAE8989462.1 hypothetical protein PF011_g18758 [Phytophthora fragariae]KAE9206662.1 hypothetical protein PF002_g19941 [Phytophthora fragariae]
MGPRKARLVGLDTGGSLPLLQHSLAESWTRTRGTQDTDVKTLCAGKSAVQNEIFAISVLAQCARTRVPAGTLQEGCTWLDSSVSGYVSFVGISLARPTKAATPGAVGIRMTASEYAEGP